MRIAGSEIPNNKDILYSLAYIKGIGLSTSRKILEGLNISFTIKAVDLTVEQREKIEAFIAPIPTGDEVVRIMIANIKKHIVTGSRRGKRVEKGLPRHGSARRAGKNAKKTSNQLLRGNIK
jgi:small subunit ribosomal protein S13